MTGDKTGPVGVIGDELMKSRKSITNFCEAIIDVFVKSRKFTNNVIPAKAGIQEYMVVTKALDPGFRRGDDFLRDHHCSRKEKI